jgi:hypothetical protein
MPRLLTPAMITALSAPDLRPALFVSMQFASSTVYLWSGLGPITWNSMTFIGVGDLGKISTISEGSTVEAQSVTIELSGIPSDMMTEVLTETRLLGAVNIWLALFDPVTGVLIADPFMSYQGKMDEPSMTDDGTSCTCAITVENVLVDLNRAVYRRYTNDDQQLDLAATLTRLGMSPTTIDTGFRWVPGVQEMVTFWGTSPSNSNNV